MRSPSASTSGRSRALAALEALAAGDPGVEAGKRARQRRDLADRAALVGIAQPQAGIGVVRRQHGRIGPRDAHVGQPEQRDDLVAVAVRRAEDLAGVDEDDRDRRIDRGGEMQEHDGFRAEARDERDLARRTRDGSRRRARRACASARSARSGARHARRAGLRSSSGRAKASSSAIERLLEGRRAEPAIGVEERLAGALALGDVGVDERLDRIDHLGGGKALADDLADRGASRRPSRRA